MTASKKPAFFEFRSSHNFIVFTVAIAVFTDIFLYGLIVPVFPFALEERTGITPDSVQRWVSILLAVYGAGLLVASPVCGYIADHTSGRMLPFMIGLVALAGSTVLLCVGSSIAVLILGRLLQGMSAAVVWVVGLALLADTVGGDEIGKAMGIVSAALSAGMFIAPLLGGVVYEHGGYYAVFGMAFGVIGVDVVLRLLIIEKSAADKWRRENEGTVEEVETPEAELAAPEKTTVKLFGRVVNLPPVITLLAHPRLLCALWGSLMQAILMTAFETTVPLFVRDTFGFSSTGAGLIFLAIIVPSFFGPWIGKLCDLYGTRLIATAGFLFGAPFLILLRITTHNSTQQIVVFCVLLVLVGVALTLVITPFMAEITLVVLELEEERPGRFGKFGAFAQAYGLFNIAFAAGSLAGPLLGGFVNEAAGWGTLTLVLGVICGASAAPTIVWTGGRLRKGDLKLRRLDKNGAEGTA